VASPSLPAYSSWRWQPRHRLAWPGRTASRRPPALARIPDRSVLEKNQGPKLPQRLPAATPSDHWQPDVACGASSNFKSLASTSSNFLLPSGQQPVTFRCGSIPPSRVPRSALLRPTAAHPAPEKQAILCIEPHVCLLMRCPNVQTCFSRSYHEKCIPYSVLSAFRCH
jgi:hypothetical protein